MDKKKLPVTGGYDSNGELTNDPGEIYQTQRVLPVGFWKGSGLSLITDVLLTALTGGKSVKQITEGVKESGLTQLFISIHKEDLHEQLINEIIAFTKSSQPSEPGGKIYYPGERTLITRRESLEKGVEVNEEVWEVVRGLRFDV